MATDEEISQAIQSLFQESQSNPSSAAAAATFTTLNAVVRQLESKLGSDLTDKIDFINTQIHLLLRSQQPPPPSHPPPPQHPPSHRQQIPPHQYPQPHPQLPPKDHFALHQNPNFPGIPPASSTFLNFSSSNPSSIKHEPVVPDGSHLESAAFFRSEGPKESSQTKPKRRGGPGGLNKLCGVSPELQVIVGQPAMPRTEIVKQLWAYIRKNNLQDPGNKRKIICNDELRVVFETDSTDMFKMNKLLAKHIIPLEPTKQPSVKKQKVDEGSGTKAAEPGPSVMISEALANFFRVGEREMLQTDVLQRIWEYIKVNNLEDPVNPMVILCDEKLQELFGSKSISALGIPEVLARHHIFRNP